MFPPCCSSTKPGAARLRSQLIGPKPSSISRAVSSFREAAGDRVRGMPLASTNGIELEYEAFGDSADPAMLLVMGLGMQLLAWEEGFCRMLAERGFYVIRYDNRDVG